MSMIFPGMDPYLEHPSLWPGVHAALVVYIRDQLQPLLRPRYFAAVEERVYLEGPGQEIIPDVWLRERPLRRKESERGESGAVAVAAPPTDTPEVVIAGDLEIHEPYIEILDRSTGQKIVTVIEVISPSNKVSGAGRDSYLSKQREVRRSDAHLVEIDLLREGHSVVALSLDRLNNLGDYDYVVCVERAPRGRFEIYRRMLRDRLPTVSIPLAGDDPDVPLRLQDAVAQVYEAGAYRDRIDYSQPCFPALSNQDQSWADDLVRTASVIPAQAGTE